MAEEEKEVGERVGQEQIHGLLFGDKLSWQAIIYDLINTEQLDPWDIDLSLLANKYLEKIKLLEEANFFVSSKVLLAASLLLRIKSEILLNEHISSIDDILFGKKEEKKQINGDGFEFDEDVPGLIPRTPLPRLRKVTLPELMAALGKAISTENRRIKKVVLERQQELETALSLPKSIPNIRERISELYAKIKVIFEDRDERFPFSELAGKTNEERIAAFVPLLHLDTQQKVWLEQEQHFEEIWVLLKAIYERKNADLLDQMMKEVEAEMKDFEAEAKADKLEEGLEDEDEEEIVRRENSGFGSDMDED